MEITKQEINRLGEIMKEIQKLEDEMKEIFKMGKAEGDK